MRVLLSVDDKSGLIEFASGLHALGADLVASGRTQRALLDAGLPCTAVATVTGFPEILGGRVKTLHPRVHGGILARPELPADVADLQANAVPLFDMVVSNLYPFAAALSQPGVSDDELVEKIDIGGVALMRAAAKNFYRVIIVSSPDQYDEVLASLNSEAGVTAAQRRRLAAEAFAITTAYDAAIADWMIQQPEQMFPQEVQLRLVKVRDLRYGENPHQHAAWYQVPSRDGLRHGLTGAEQLNGKEVSFNNLLDLQAALDACTDFAAPTVAIVKHTNPCGLASHASQVEAFRLALAGDPVAAYGGVIGINQTVDEATAREIRPLNFDAIIATGYDEKALAILKRKKQGQFIVLQATADAPSTQPNHAGFDLAASEFKWVSGGVLLQTRDSVMDSEMSVHVASQRQPTEAELRDLLFAFRACKHVKSNCVVLVHNRAVVGIGAGQQSRVLAARIAVEQAGRRAQSAVMATDGFFPFPDGAQVGIDAGVTAIMHPGGSIRDQETIDACDARGIALVTSSGLRHFRH